MGPGPGILKIFSKVNVGPGPGIFYMTLFLSGGVFEYRVEYRVGLVYHDLHHQQETHDSLGTTQQYITPRCKHVWYIHTQVKIDHVLEQDAH